MTDPATANRFDRAIADLEQQVLSDPPAALGTGTALLATIDGDGTIAQRIGVRRLLAMAYAHTSQFETALAVCQEARTLPGAESEPVEAARVLLASMQPLANLGRIDEAIEAGEEALRTFEHQGVDIMAGRAALNIGALSAMTGRFAEALPWFDRAGTYLSDNPMMLGQIETNRGTALAALDCFEEAEAAFGRASAALSTEELAWAQAIAEGNLADLAARQGEINRSLRHFENSRRHLEADEAWADLGRLNAEEAAALAMTGLSRVAQELFASAIDMLREHGTPADLASALVAYGTTLADADALDEAGHILDETRPLVSADEQPTLYLQFLALRARLAIARTDLSDARAAVDDALPHVADRPIQRLRWSIIQARIARLSGDTAGATSILTDALRQAQVAGVQPLVADIATSLVELSQEGGDQDAADDYARHAIAATEGVRDTIQADRIRQSWHRERLDVYKVLYRSALASPDPLRQAEAFDAAERIRSRTLLDAMQVRSSDVGVPQPASPAETALVEERQGHRRWLNWMYSSLADGAEPTAEQVAELHGRERAVALIDDRLATLRPRSPLGAPMSLDALQESLAEEFVTLAYLRTGDTYTVQVISRHGVSGIPNLASAEDVGALVAQLQFQVNRALAHGDRPISASRQARLLRDTDGVLERMYQMLVEPVADHITGASRLIVIPSSDLYGVPFAALRDADGYLVDRFEIATAPGVSILASLRHEGLRIPARPFVAGVPDDDAPALGEEARFVAGLFPHATTLMEEDATRQAVLDAMPRADLIHLACHGRFDSVHPTASGLRMADGWLTLDQLMEIRLDAAQVVLTGCETGRVRVERGDDLAGIITALITSGAIGLLTSLWKTHDQAATDSMAAFYDGMMRGMNSLAALRASQLAVREQFPHPAHWAPFIGVYASRKGVH
jgi:CHAT domain-containing protein/tetratricopeptide (TPR) repeat protein